MADINVLDIANRVWVFFGVSKLSIWLKSCPALKIYKDIS